MSRSSRTMRILKWVGLAACLALLVAVVVQPATITFKSTEVWFHNSIIFFYQQIRPGMGPVDFPNWKRQIANRRGFLPTYGSITMQAGTLRYVSLPPKPLLCFMAVATWVLWRCDARYPVGCCQGCGYNLRGLAKPRCPECSKEFDPSTMPQSRDSG